MWWFRPFLFAATAMLPIFLGCGGGGGGGASAPVSSQAAPVITSEPQPQTVLAPASATFSVQATGSPAPSYQWALNGSPLSGATGSSYTTGATTAAMDGGNYTVTVSNGVGNPVISSAAILTVHAAPSITTQPVSVTVASGNPAVFSVQASGNPAPTYQWNLNGNPVQGQTQATYTIGLATGSMTGDLVTVMVTNTYGSVLSSAGTLTVTQPTLGDPEGLYLGTIVHFYSGLTSNAIAMASPNGNVCMTDLQNLVFFDYATGAGTLYATNQTSGQTLSIIAPYVNPSTFISGTYQVPSVANDQFGLNYNSLYTQVSSVASLAGNYTWTEIHTQVQVSNPATLDASGNISGTNAEGVAFTGALVQPDLSKNLYTVTVHDANGHTYSGLAFWAPTGAPAGFIPNAIFVMVQGTNTNATMGGFFTHN